MTAPINFPNYDYESESAHGLTGRQDDVVIAVMGATGTGKSSFIRLLAGDTSVGVDFESASSDVQVPHPRDRNVTIIDTPGFDDSSLDFSDTDILKTIADFLLEEYGHKRKLNGLIYVQRISDPRFSGQSSRNLRMFRELCGQTAYKNVVILTTYWDQVSTHEGVRREAQLKSKFFAKLVEGGAHFMRHDRTVESAHKVLQHIFPMPPTVTPLQKEIRKGGKSLEKTAARSAHSEEVGDGLANYKEIAINPPNYDDNDPESKSAHDLTGRQNDVVIAVMGVTGTGKSSFIKLLTGDTSVKVGDGLESETSDLQVLHFRDRDSGRKVTIVDAPGFDDSRLDLSDANILKMVAGFLLKEYDQKRKLNGLIYVQRISDPRFSGQSKRNLRMFRELCGETAYKNVVVLTTYWDQVSTHEEGVRREVQLKSSSFAKLVEGGAHFMRHDRTVESTRKVLRHILPIPPTVTQIQKEIREEGKSLEKTTAGSAHSKEVEDALAKYKKKIADLTAEMATVKENNKAARQELQTELTELRNSLAGREREQADLKRGLDEERKLRKQLEAKADEMRAQFQQQIQSLNKVDQATALRKHREAIKEAVDSALREARKQPLSRRLMDVAEDVPLLPNFIGKPILGGIGLGLDLMKGIFR